MQNPIVLLMIRKISGRGVYLASFSEIDWVTQVEVHLGLRVGDRDGLVTRRRLLKE